MSTLLVVGAVVTPDPKPPERIVDRAAIERKMHDDPECRVSGKRATDPHHLIWKSAGGDDVEANIVPLVHEAHMTYHFGTGSEPMRIGREIARRLHVEEVEYVIRKLGLVAGVDYLRRRYDFTYSRWIYRTDVPLWPRFWRAASDAQRRRAI